jgi:hypothetical protein
MVLARAHNRIDLIVTGRYDEFRAASAVKPGTVLLQNADTEVAPHSTAGTCYEVIVALHNQKAGKTVDDDWAAGDLVSVIYPAIGDVLAMVLESGQEVAPDDFLTVTNTGTLKVATSAEHRLFRAIDTKDGTGSADRLCRVRRVA